MIGFIRTSLQLQSFMIAHNQWLITTRSSLYRTTSVFSSTATGRTTNQCSHTHWTPSEFSYESTLTLRPTVSLGIKHPSGANDQILITARQLRFCWCRALSLTRGRVCLLQLLLAFASAVILGSESRGIRDHILLSQSRDFLFRRLLRLTGMRWRYSTPPPRGCGGIKSKSHWDWRSVSLSVLVSRDVSSCLKVTVLSMWGASLTRDRICHLSVIVGSISPLSFVQLFTILLLKSYRMYNIYRASVSPGPVQQTMPYF
jgi:hypothetical protein